MIQILINPYIWISRIIRFCIIYDIQEHSDAYTTESLKNSEGIERPSLAGTIPRSPTSTGVLIGMAEKSNRPISPF